MLELGMHEFGHEWEKKNVVTVSSRKGLYDLYVCKNCGIEGRSYRLGEIRIEEKYRKKAFSCRGVQRSKKIKVTNCRACGDEFKALVPGSVHTVVASPNGKDNARGEWVMGTTEPVLLLFGEFVYIDQEE